MTAYERYKMIIWKQNAEERKTRKQRISEWGDWQIEM